MLFSALLTGCGGIFVQAPAPTAGDTSVPLPQAPRAVERPATPARAANAELMFQVLTSLGIDYQNGGRSPKSGFDCSGLVAHVYQEAFGIRLPQNFFGPQQLGEVLAIVEDDTPPWHLKTTAEQLAMIRAARLKRGEDAGWIEEAETALNARRTELEAAQAKAAAS